QIDSPAVELGDPDPVERPLQLLHRFAKRQQTVELARLRRYEQHRLPNHSIARASAPSTPDGENPNSRRAFSWVTHIFLLAILTASRGTRGSTPVSIAQPVDARPAAYAAAYGSRTTGALRPANLASRRRISANVRFSQPRI